MKMAIAIVLLTAGVAAQQPPRDTRPVVPTALTAVVHGRVTTDAGQPVGRAIVTVAGLQPGGARTAITDEDGRFSIANLPAGRFSVYAVCRGWIQSRYGQATPGGPETLVALAAGDRFEANLVLRRGASISGTLVDAGGEPLTYSSVTAARWIEEGHQRTLRYLASEATDDRGGFRFWGLAGAEYVLYASRQAQYGGLPPGAVTVTVATGEDRHGVTVDAARAGTTARVEGSALGPDGQPIRGTRIQLLETTTRAIVRDPVTTADGSFLFRAVPPGRYTAVAHASIYPAPAGGTRSSPAIFWGMNDVQVDGTATVVTNISLARGVSLSGKIVRAAGGAPTDAARFYVFLASFDLPEAIMSGVASGSTQPDGAFSIHGIPPGRYVLRIAGQAIVARTVQSAMAGTVDAIDSPIRIDREDVSGIVVTISDVQTQLLGRLRRDPGASATGPSVVVYSADKRKWLAASRRWVQVARPDTRGDFEVRGLPPGEYYVAVVDHLPADGWDSPAFLGTLAPEATVTLAEGEPVTREFTRRARAPR